MIKNKMKQCTITLTRNCNLRCKFCYAMETGYCKDDFICIDDIRKIIDICDVAKTKYIVLTGGEPTLYPNLLDVIQYIKETKNKITPTIVTNGLKLEDINFCRQIIDSGVQYIDISLRGSNQQNFKEITGSTDYKKVLAAINNLSNLKVDFTCSMVVTIQNIDYLCDAIRNAYNNGGRKFSFTFEIDNGNENIKNEIYLERHNPFLLVNAFMEKIEEINSITKGEWWIEYSYPLCVYTEQQLKILKDKLAAPCQIFMKNAITFDEKKNLIPCSMNINQKLGKLGTDFTTYEELKEKMASANYQAAIKQLNALPSKKCLLCKYLKSCLGGCTFFWTHCDFDSLMKFKKA